MPSRVLREGILDSATVATLSPHAELFYRKLMSVVDDYGRFDARPSLLRSRLYPVQVHKIREADVARWLAECETAGLIVLYEVACKPYLLFHKLGTPRSEKSKFPDPPAHTAKPIDGQRASKSHETPPYTGVPYSGSDSITNSESDSTPTPGGGENFPPPTFEEVKNAWNSIPGITQTKYVSVHLKRSFSEACMRPLFCNEWREGIIIVARSPRCKGASGWVADLKWFLKDGSLEDLLNGSYEPVAPAANGFRTKPEQPSTADKIAAIRAKQQQEQTP